MPKTTLLRKQVTPVGSIQPHAGSTAPDGFLACDGSIVNIADYPKLYAAIGTSWGHGNEVSPGVSDGLTFHLPDLRGMFLRGKDDATGRDPNAGTRTAANAGGNVGDTVGSVQDDAFQGHHHNIVVRFSNGTSGVYPLGYGDGANYFNNVSGKVTTPQDMSGQGSVKYTSETRPKNVNVNYIIKAE